MRALVALASLCLLFGCSASTTSSGSSTSRSSSKASSSKAGGGSSGHGGPADAGPDGGASGSGSSAGGGSSSGGSTGSGGSSVSSSAVGGSSSGGASSSAGNGSGDGGLFVCGDGTVLPDGGACSTGAYVTQVVDLFTCAPIAGATVGAIGAQGVPLPGSVTTAPDGTFVLCDQGGGAFTPTLTATGYLTMYYGELQGGTYSSLAYVPAVSSSSLAVLVDFLPGYDSSLGMLIVDVSPSSTCTDPSGWTIALTGGDGGAIADGGYAEIYLGNSSLPQPGATATTENGNVIFYNVDVSTLSYFAVTATNPDAGACPIVRGGVFDTGRLYVQGNAITIAVLLLP